MKVAVIQLAFKNPEPESQRDSDPKPRVATKELPWEVARQASNPNGVVSAP